MGYSAMNVSEYTKENFRKLWNEKYADRICWIVLVLTVIVINGLVIYFNGIIIELIFSVPLSGFAGMIVACINDEILKAIYIRIKIRRKLKADAKQKEAESFSNFINSCRIKR
ncbi:hypothetical protein CPT_Merlin139 [Citrobacter phage Merlin]|uniref:Uncharacterized protein n=1 Tax=Citrobacter phage Merlin TaxID=1675602 RepID=A0A0K1LNQ1_9CAUD|nr:hypothetical protein CPT_Merlin139 [Citrobacter phage Merlin]AKU43785.1 hypothetical protein CPT_Merlin139 [Citrobacter phage Merlin]